MSRKATVIFAAAPSQTRENWAQHALILPSRAYKLRAAEKFTAITRSQRFDNRISLASTRHVLSDESTLSQQVTRKFDADKLQSDVGLYII
jgi:hypothetical protein